MRSSHLVGAAIALLATDGANAARFAGRAISGNGYLSVPVGTVDKPKGLKRDSEPISTQLQNMDFFYATEVLIGTPPQPVTVLVDTGSSELWVNPDCSTASTSQQQSQCQSFGQYNPNKSKTPPIGPFGSEKIRYGDPTDPSTQTSVDIVYFTDNIAFGKDGAHITNQTFGVVEESEGQSQGILGLAPDLLSGFDGKEPYSLVLNTMAQEGVIASRVFSLDLRHADAETGAIIYGGLDKSKFIGSLSSIPFIRGIQGEFRLAVKLDSMGVTLNGKTQSFNLRGNDTNVMLDSGTTLSRMSPAVARPILEALDAQDDGDGFYYTSCKMRNTAGSINFKFGDQTIRVPFADFILDLGIGVVCYVGLVMTQDQQILGDSVLRAGYFVFDWDNEAVHIAQAANCGDNDIVAVSTGTAAVPSVTGNCKESDAAFTGGPLVTGTATGAVTTTFVVTSCPPFERQCTTGVTTTQTLSAQGTVTVTAGAGGDDDSAGVSNRAAGSMVLIFGTLAALYNAM